MQILTNGFLEITYLMQPSRIGIFREKQDGGTRNSRNLNIDNGRILYKYKRFDSDRAI